MRRDRHVVIANDTTNACRKGEQIMKKINGMNAIRVRTGTVLKVVGIAAALSFAGPLADNPATASAQAVTRAEKVIRLGPFRACFFACLAPGYCCMWIGQL